jgi:hypothetical protein
MFSEVQAMTQAQVSSLAAGFAFLLAAVSGRGGKQ